VPSPLHPRRNVLALHLALLLLLQAPPLTRN
jgi:hypothetical protein